MTLKAQYKLLHCAGAALCLASLALFVLTDSTDTHAENPLLGDALAVAGASMYAACNVTQERLLREPPSPTPHETLACTAEFLKREFPDPGNMAYLSLFYVAC